MGKPMAQILTFGPKSGEQIALISVRQDTSRTAGGWNTTSQAGETQATRKVSYLLAAQGTPYVAGAGLRREAKVEDLDHRPRPAAVAEGTDSAAWRTSSTAVRPSEVAGGEADEVAFDRAAMFPFEAAPARLHDDPVALAQAPQIAASRSLGAIFTSKRTELCAALQRLSPSPACLGLGFRVQRSGPGRSDADLTGTWQGAQICDGLIGGEFAHFVVDNPLLVVQDG